MNTQRRVCPACRQLMPPTAQQCLLCGFSGQRAPVQRPAPAPAPTPAPAPAPQPSAFVADSMGPVTITADGQVHVRVANAKEAALAIKQLRVHKKEWNATKREVTHEIAQIRADYRHRVATRGSTIRGRGTLLRIARAIQTAARDGERREMADEIRPLEERKFAIERVIAEIDRLILQLEKYKLQG